VAVHLEMADLPRQAVRAAEGAPVHHHRAAHAGAEDDAEEDVVGQGHLGAVHLGHGGGVDLPLVLQPAEEALQAVVPGSDCAGLPPLEPEVGDEGGDVVALDPIRVGGAVLGHQEGPELLEAGVVGLEGVGALAVGLEGPPVRADRLVPCPYAALGAECHHHGLDYPAAPAQTLGTQSSG